MWQWFAVPLSSVVVQSWLVARQHVLTAWAGATVRMTCTQWTAGFHTLVTRPGGGSWRCWMRESTKYWRGDELE
jgi:hypothetical protein